MSRRKNNKEKKMILLSDAIKEIGIEDSTDVIIRHYGKGDEEVIPAGEISKKDLTRELLMCTPHQGGKKYGYGLYLFVIK